MSLLKKRFFSLLLTSSVTAFMLLSTGCGVLLQTRKTTLLTAQDSTILNVSEGANSASISSINTDNSDVLSDHPSNVINVTVSNFNSDGDHSILAKTRATDIHVSNKVPSYFITESKKGYLSYGMPIVRYRFNPGKGIDLALHVVGAGILLAILSNSLSNTDANGNATNTQQGPLFPPAIGIASVYFGGWGWLDLFLGPWKLFPRTATLPPLVKIPYRTNDENKLYVKNVGVDIKKNNLKETYYKTFGDYKNHNAIVNKADENSIKHRNTQFADTLNHILANWNYLDTNTGFFAHVYNGAYYLKCEVEDFSIVGVQAYMYIDFKCTWHIYGVASDKEIYSSSTDCMSSWSGLSEGDFGFDAFATDVLQSSMAQFLNTDEVQKCLHDKSAVTNAMQKWAPIPVTETAKDSVASLDDAVQAVVTVVVPEGHGSGCIISPDGYLITNHHVVTEDTTDKVKILFSNGDSGTATVLRSNAEYDLAVLKLDKPGTYKYFPVDTVTKDVPIGDDVYAIGTPESIDLGQTLTKGIISGVRSAGNRTIMQTDVSINPGNSGGALVNSTGHLIGIVNAKLAGVGIQGIGFAIPVSYIDDALKVQFSR